MLQNTFFFLFGFFGFVKLVKMLSVGVGTLIELLAFLFIKNLHSKQLSSNIPFPVPSKNDTDSAPGLLY